MRLSQKVCSKFVTHGPIACSLRLTESELESRKTLLQRPCLRIGCKHCLDDPSTWQILTTQPGIDHLLYVLLRRCFCPFFKDCWLKSKFIFSSGKRFSPTHPNRLSISYSNQVWKILRKLKSYVSPCWKTNSGSTSSYTIYFTRWSYNLQVSCHSTNTFPGLRSCRPRFWKSETLKDEMCFYESV